jgi:hypothetical protein
LIGILLLCVGWWRFSPYSPRVVMPAYLNDGVDCSQFPPMATGDEPLQTEIPQGMQPFVLPKVKITPLAGFSMPARVLHRAAYLYDEPASISTTDWFVGWGFMANEKIVKRLKFEQRGRFGGIAGTKDGGAMPYSYDDMYLNASNVHLIPANKKIAAQINGIKVGDNVRVDGWLVRVDMGNRYVVSSLSRTDRGAGACEVILVCNVTRLASEKVWPDYK